MGFDPDFLDPNVINDEIEIEMVGAAQIASLT